MVTIIYAYRNRDESRIKVSLDSLKNQTNQNFKVVFVDYGSESKLAATIRKLVESYSFASYYYVHADLLLWNKSKALNYGITKVTTPYVFIADVDLIYHPDVIKLFQSIAKPNNASIFKLGYLDKETSQKLHESVFFDDLKPNHFGEVNGMILTSKEALEKVNGYDTFFHFYGAEDVDLCQRIENAGFTITLRDELFFYHNWHVIYNSYNDQKMSLVPRLYNVKRINEQHYFTNKKEQLIQPHNQGVFGEVVSKENQDSLKNPDITFTMNNIHSNVHHFFNEHLKTHKNKVIHVEIKEDNYSRSIKYLLKKLLKKNSQPYMSMKEVNDIILMNILYNFKDFNYAYHIDNNLKKITFTIKM
jgi:GT2 family glycosyltransferase